MPVATTVPHASAAPVTTTPSATAAPPAAAHRSTVTGEVYDDVAAFLCGRPYPKGVALVIAAAGLLSVADAKRFAKGIFVFAAFVVGSVLVGDQAAQSWAGELTDLQAQLVTVEAGAILAAAAYVGFKGFQLVLGACAALGVLHVFAKCAVAYGWLPDVPLPWFVLYAFAGVVAVRLLRSNATAVIGPLVGGWMVANSIVFLGFDLLSDTPESLCWIDFVGTLYSGRGAALADAGEGSLVAARVAYLAVLSLVAALGISRHFYKVPAFKLPNLLTVPPAGRPAPPPPMGVHEHLLPPRPSPPPSSSGGSRTGSRPGGTMAPPPFKFSRPGH